MDTNQRIDKLLVSVRQTCRVKSVAPAGTVPLVLAAAREAVQVVAGDSAIGELILVKGGYYAGHRFTFDDGYAVWFLDEQQVKIHRQDGALVKAMSLAGKDERRAA